VGGSEVQVFEKKIEWRCVHLALIFGTRLKSQD